MARRKRSWVTRDRLEREAAARGEISNRRGAERMKRERSIVSEFLRKIDQPSYWGGGLTFYDDVYLETNPENGGLGYKDAQRIVPQVKQGYRISQVQRRGQHILVSNAAGQKIYVELYFDRQTQTVQLKKPRLNNDPQGQIIYGETDDSSRILDYKPELEQRVVTQFQPRPEEEDICRDLEWRRFPFR